MMIINRKRGRGEEGEVIVGLNQGDGRGGKHQYRVYKNLYDLQPSISFIFHNKYGSLFSTYVSIIYCL